jgi:hypothetical protein
VCVCVCVCVCVYVCAGVRVLHTDDNVACDSMLSLVLNPPPMELVVAWRTFSGFRIR